tara:strand:+ start:1419 stop:1859 length:441 start_codon:yes stop_codon:yes gene_type:complete
MLVKFNKPFNVLSQFSDKTEKSADRGNLSDFISIPNIYPVGRLDKDSEGLMLLTDDGKLQYSLSNPKNRVRKTYYVQVEGEPKQSDLDLLRAGLKLRDGITRPAEAKIIEPHYSGIECHRYECEKQSQILGWKSLFLREGTGKLEE